MPRHPPTKARAREEGEQCRVDLVGVGSAVSTSISVLPFTVSADTRYASSGTTSVIAQGADLKISIDSTVVATCTGVTRRVDQPPVTVIAPFEVARSSRNSPSESSSISISTEPFEVSVLTR
jgi:hypothetical protein